MTLREFAANTAERYRRDGVVWATVGTAAEAYDGLHRRARRARLELAQRRADSWEDYYLGVTKADDDPRALVGPPEKFEEHREWQFALLCDHGLEPADRVLELGCGVLRAGIPIIEYVDAGHYAGMDISRKALLYGHAEVHERDLECKRPLLVENGDLSFREVEGFGADYLLANSVWTHLPPDRLRECIGYMHRGLAPGATILTTVWLTDATEPEDREPAGRPGVDWAYPEAWLRRELQYHGWVADRLDVSHPTDQTVLKITAHDVSRLA